MFSPISPTTACLFKPETPTGYKLREVLIRMSQDIFILLFWRLWGEMFSRTSGVEHVYGMYVWISQSVIRGWKCHMSPGTSAQNPASDVQAHPGHRRNQRWERMKTLVSHLECRCWDPWNKNPGHIPWGCDASKASYAAHRTQWGPGRKGGFGSGIL